MKIDGQINPNGETILALGKLAGQAVKAAQSSNTQSAPAKFFNSKSSDDQTSTTRVKNKFVIPAHAGTQLTDSPVWVPDQVRDDNDVERSGLTDDAFAENQRAARYLASRDGIGEFSKFVADGIETDGDKAIAETVDLYNQTRELNPNQADALIDKVLPGLSPDNVKRLQSAIKPMEHGPEHNPLDSRNLSDFLEDFRQKREAESALFDRLQGDAGEENHQQQKSTQTLDERAEDSFGLKADIERPQGILPMPDKTDGAWHQPGDRDWSSWTAPEWVHEGVKAVALPKHILDGGAWSEEDATKAALTIGAGGAVTKAPKEALRSGSSRLRGSPKFMRSIDLQKQGQDAAKKVIDEKESIQQAMFRSDVGEITFDHGSPTFGLDHIRIERRIKDGMTDGQAKAFVTKRVPEILANGSLSRIYGPAKARRADITYKGGRVSLSLRRLDNQETWVVTGFEDWN